MLNAREIAALIWLGVAAVGVLAWPNSRRALLPSMRQLAGRKVGISLVLTFAYIVALVLLGRSVGLWRPSLIPDTVTWVFGTALVMLFNVPRAMKDPRFFRRAVLQTLTVTTVVQFIANGYPFGVITEVIMQGVVLVLAVVYAYTETTKEKHPEHAPVHRLLFWLLAAVGTLVVVRSLVHYLSAWDQLSVASLSRQFALPIWLTLLFLPFFYLVVLYAAYETALAPSEGMTRLRSFVALVIRYGGDVNAVSAFGYPGGRKLRQATSIREALKVIDDHRARHAEQARREQAKADTLARFAGVDGEDEGGRRLDRREFTETTGALLTLSSCHTGHYRQRGSYRPDLVTLLGGILVRDGLPAEHGIEMTVTDDGQAWCAWRRTASGWVVAVGANGPPPGNQWMADGPEPPAGPAWCRSVLG